MKRLLFALLIGTITMSFVPSHLILPTSLKITVLNSLGNPVEEAKVTLYSTEDDYRNEKNAVSETLQTDAKGQVKFKNLEAKVYFVHVVKGEMNNDGGAAQTNKLEEGKQNRTNIIIE